MAINGRKIDAKHSLTRLLQDYEPGREVEITYLRSGKEFKVKLKLAEMPH